MFGKDDMDYSILLTRLGKSLRQRRLHRGLTQAQLASMAALTRQKIIAIEKGDASVAVGAYARAIAALDCDLTIAQAAMPTLDEIQGVFD